MRRAGNNSNVGVRRTLSSFTWPLTDIRLIPCSACDSELGCLTDPVAGGDAYGKPKPASLPAGGGEAVPVSSARNLRRCLS